MKWKTDTADGSLKLNDDGTFTLTGSEPGTAELPVKAKYTLGDKQYTAWGSLRVTVKALDPETGGSTGAGGTEDGTG